jgi:RNA-directed DNA polymerase
MGEMESAGKPFEISKRAVWEAYREVAANKGAPGVDGVTISGFEKVTGQVPVVGVDS